jgi:peptidyl-dipeptidase A
LIQKSVDDTAHDINFLFAMAMDKVMLALYLEKEVNHRKLNESYFLSQVVFLPYALALEQWRYDVFSKKIRKEQFNCHYWLLR